MKKLIQIILLLLIAAFGTAFSQVKLTKTEIPTSATGTMLVESVDIDSDGDIDFVAGDSDGNLIIMYSDGSGAYTETVVSSSLSEIKSLAIADIDTADSALDIICLTGKSDSSLVVFAADGTGNFSPSVPLARDLSGSGDFSVFDFDGNSYLDIVIADTPSDSVFAYLGDSLMTYTEKYIGSSLAAPSMCIPEDIDGDSDTDILVVSYDSEEIGVYSADSAGVYSYSSLVTSMPSKFAKKVDFEGDGDFDFLYSHFNFGRVMLLKNDGTGNFSTDTIITGTAKYHDYEFIDIDGTSPKDLFLAMTNKIFYYWYALDGTDAKPYQMEMNGSYYSSDIGDFNGDTREDIVYGGPTGEIVYYLNTAELDMPFVNRGNDGATDVPLLTNFEWSPVYGADGYILQVSDTTDFTTSIIDTTVDVAYYSIKELVLSENTEYFWRATATKGTDTSGARDTLSFTTGEFALDSAILHIPADSTLFVDTNAVFAWHPAEHADSYRFELAEDAGLTTVLIDSTVADTTLILNDTLEVSTRYYWRVTAINYLDTAAASDIYEFATRPAAYPSPVLISPADSAENVPLTAELIWNEAPGALEYQFQIAESDSFAVPVLDSVIETNTITVPEGDLTDTSRYFWRVRAVRNADSSVWTEVRTFKTDVIMLMPPVMTYPANNADGLPFAFELMWEPVAKADSYIVQVSDDAAFANLVLDTEVDTTVATLSDLGRGVLYYWRVKSLNATDTTDWSDTLNFTVRKNHSVLAIDGVAPHDFIDGDFDGNGKIDIAFSSKTGTPQWWYMDTGMNLTFKSEISGDSNTTHIAGGDIWGNGNYAFALTSNDSGFLKVRYFDGSNFSDLYVDDSVGIIADITMLDIDGDNIREIIYFDESTYEFIAAKIDSADNSVTKTVISSGDSLLVSCFALADLDTNGRADLVYPAREKGSIGVYHQDTSGLFTRSSDISVAIPGPISFIDLVDYEGDGDFDILIASKDSSKISIFFNDGTGNFSPTSSMLIGSAQGVNYAALGDYTGEGTPDVFTALGSTNEVAVYENDGGAIVEKNVLYSNFENPNFVLPYDFDGDGDLDVLTASETEKQIILIENLKSHVPALIAPADSSTGVALMPTFTWHKAKDADKYTIQLSEKLDFSVLTGQETLADTVLISPDSLLYGTRYFWRVKGLDAVEEGDWSEIRTFITDSLELEKPVLTSPADGATDQALTLTLDWEAVTLQEGYVLQVSETDSFDTFIINDIISDADQYTFPADTLNNNTTYWWRVRVIYQAYEGPWSDVRNFTTEAAGIVQSLILEEGRNTVSLHIEPLDARLSKIFEGIDKLDYVLDSRGNLFKPSDNVDNIGDWNVEQAYDVIMKSAALLEVSGTEIPEEELNKYNLTTGLNYISWCYDSTKAVEEAMAATDSNFVYLIDGDGNLFMPEYRVDGIGSLQVGTGYKIYMKSDAPFSYIPADSSLDFIDYPRTEQPIYILPKETNSVDYCHVIVEGALPDIAEITAFGENGNIVGSGACEGGKAVVTIHSDDQRTPETDGAKTSEELTLRAYYPDAKEFIELVDGTITNIITGANPTSIAYHDTYIYHLSADPVSVQENPAISAMLVSPMPVEKEAKLRITSESPEFGSINIFNLQGQAVSEIYTGDILAGTNIFTINAEGLASGTYIAVVSTSRGIKTTKIIIK